MSANVETMFYTGETPWHGLGKKVDTALTSAEALNAAGLNWTVDSRPIFIQGDREIPNYRANVRSTDDAVLGVVSNRYEIVQNTDAFQFTDSLIGDGVTYETAGSLANGKRVWLLSKLEKTKVCGDDVIPYLVFTNSFDGTGAVKVAITPIRVVCQNTLTLALSKANRTWSMKHTSKIGGKLEQAQSTLFNTEKYMEYLKKRAEEMTEIVVARPDFLAFLQAAFPVADGMSERSKKTVMDKRDAFEGIYQYKDDLSKFRGTVYGVIQAVADFMPHIEPARRTNNYQENKFMQIADGGKTCFMDMACKYFE